MKNGANTRAHFAGGFFGEGDGEDGTDGVALFEQMQVTSHQREGFPRTRACRGRDGARRIGDGCFLVAFEGEGGEEGH